MLTVMLKCCLKTLEMNKTVDGPPRLIKVNMGCQKSKLSQNRHLWYHLIKFKTTSLRLVDELNEADKGDDVNK